METEEKDINLEAELKEEKTKKEKHDKKNKDSKLVEDLKQEVAELTDKCARAQAEVINFKKRKEDETALRLKYCNEDLLLKFVGVCDNFERAIKMDDNDLSDEVSKFLEGFKMMYTNMREILKSNEVVEIDCEGREFDATVMEAILVEHDDTKPDRKSVV